MISEPNLPPEFESLLNLLKGQPQTVRELFHYAVVLMMLDDEKARMVRTYQQDGKTFWQVSSISGDEFVIVKPELSEATEQMLVDEVRKIVVEDLNEEE
jgi:hypothetical protein